MREGAGSIGRVLAFSRKKGFRPFDFHHTAAWSRALATRRCLVVCQRAASSSERQRRARQERLQQGATLRPHVKELPTAPSPPLGLKTAPSQRPGQRASGYDYFWAFGAPAWELLNGTRSQAASECVLLLSTKAVCLYGRLAGKDRGKKCFFFPVGPRVTSVSSHKQRV